MGSLYYASFDSPGMTVSENVWSLEVAANDIVMLHGFEVSNLTEAGEAQEEMLELQLIRQTGAVTGATGDGVTPRPTITGDTAGTTVNENITADVSGGTAEILAKIAWNVRVPYLFMPVPEGRIQVRDSDVIYLDLISTPNDAIDIMGWILFEEM